jgi:hypothetical protein
MWSRRTRRAWVVATAAMHLGIAMLMGLGVFGAIMIVLTVAAFGVRAAPARRGGEKPVVHRGPLIYLPPMRERLAAILGDVYWSDLRAHAARDALIVVADELDLLDVGVAVATDDAPRVERWIQARQLTKPTAAELSRWPAEPLAMFESLVVAPYVLIRPRRRRESAPVN